VARLATRRLEDPPGWHGIDWEEEARGVEAGTRRAATDPDALRHELEAEDPAWGPGGADRRVADFAECDGAAVAAALRRGSAFDLAALAATAA
jgi:hypothetical protein